MLELSIIVKGYTLRKIDILFKQYSSPKTLNIFKPQIKFDNQIYTCVPNYLTISLWLSINKIKYTI